MTVTYPGVSANTFFGPYGAAWDGRRLFIADDSNARVLVYNSIPTANNAPADVVIGQPNFTSNAVNQGGGARANTISVPDGIAFDGKRLFVGDAGNRRVTIYDVGSSSLDPGPQFDQGKALVGKVFEDLNGNGIQDAGTAACDGGAEKGIEGVRVTSDTGIYAITDFDGKYHFPYIEVGQRLLKIDESTLPDGSVITTDNPYKATVTEGVLTKVSFGVRLPAAARSLKVTADGGPLLKVSVSQDPVMLKPVLSVSHRFGSDSVEFTITCNYFLFIARSRFTIYDSDYAIVKTIDLPNPIPSRYTIPLTGLPEGASYYQLSVYDKNGKMDRTGVGKLTAENKNDEKKPTLSTDTVR